MGTISRITGVVAAGALALTAACAGGTDGADTSAPTESSAPTAEQPTATRTSESASADDGDTDRLTAALLVEEDLGAPWALLTDAFADFPGGQPGVMPEELRSLVAGVPVPCDVTDVDLSSPTWQVLTILVADVPALAGAEGPPQLQEMLFTATGEEVQQVFATLRESLMACAGEVRDDADDGGYSLTLVEVADRADLGDEAVTVHVRSAAVGEPGDASVSDGRRMLIRSGDVLALLDIVEAVHVTQFTGAWITPSIPDTDLDEIATIAAAKLD